MLPENNFWPWILHRQYIQAVDVSQVQNIVAQEVLRGHVAFCADLGAFEERQSPDSRQNKPLHDRRPASASKTEGIPQRDAFCQS